MGNTLMTDYIRQEYGDELDYSIIKHNDLERIIVLKRQSMILLLGIAKFGRVKTKEIKQIDSLIEKGGLIGESIKELGLDFKRSFQGVYTLTNVILDTQNMDQMKGIVSKLFICNIFYCDLFEIVPITLEIGVPETIRSNEGLINAKKHFEQYVNFNEIAFYENA